MDIYPNGEGNGKTTSVFLPQEPHEQYERQKYMTLADETSSSVDGQHAILGKSGEITPERIKRLAQSRNDAQLWICLVAKLKSDAVKNNIG